MIAERTMREIWRKTGLNISEAGVEIIIAEYEKRKISPVENPSYITLRSDEVYVVQDAYQDDKCNFCDLEGLKAHLSYIQENRSWDAGDFENNITLYIRRGDDLGLTVKYKSLEFEIG